MHGSEDSPHGWRRTRPRERPREAAPALSRRAAGGLVSRRWDGTVEASVAALDGRRQLAWLDSALPHPLYGRWSIVAAEPRWTLTAHGRRLCLETAAGLRRHFEGDPIAALAARVEAEQARRPAASQPARQPPELPFTGGAIGYLGFELARQIERLPATTRDDVGAPDLAFAWYDAALVADVIDGRAWLVGTGEAVDRLEARLAVPDPRASRLELCAHPGGPAVAFEANMTPADYLERVRVARRYIAAGDIYQVNLSQRLSAPIDGPGLDVYRRLRRASPAPFAAYLAAPGGASAPGLEVLSSSPERLLLAAGERLQTRPVKGTRPRGRDAAEDARLAAELRASAKDAAEHVMIVDLERNDLGRVAAVGSVAVPEFAALERYANVHHLTSTIEARRCPGVGLAELLRAVFPGGSISGAPKIRALEIIDELEPTARGVYTGAIGYVSADGRCDLNVAIRTITVAAGRAHAHVGGAIVHDSVPEAEYLETLDKARGMARALGARLPDEAPPLRRARVAAR